MSLFWIWQLNFVCLFTVSSLETARLCFVIACSLLAFTWVIMINYLLTSYQPSILLSNFLLAYGRKGVCKFYNGKSGKGSFAKLQDAVILSPPLKDLPKPETPSPRKRKGLLPFSFKWGKPQNKEVFPEDDAVDSPTNCRRLTISPAAASSSGSNSGSDDEHYRSQKPSSRRPHRRPSNAMDVFASPPAPRPPQLFSAHMRSQSMLDLQDVTDSTATVTPRDKRMKN